MLIVKKNVVLVWVCMCVPVYYEYSFAKKYFAAPVVVSSQSVVVIFIIIVVVIVVIAE